MVRVWLGPGASARLHRFIPGLRVLSSDYLCVRVCWLRPVRHSIFGLSTWMVVYLVRGASVRLRRLISGLRMLQDACERGALLCFRAYFVV